MEAMTHGAVALGLSIDEIAEKHPQYAEALEIDARERSVSQEALLRFVRDLAHCNTTDPIAAAIGRRALAVLGGAE